CRPEYSSFMRARLSQSAWIIAALVGPPIIYVLAIGPACWSSERAAPTFHVVGYLPDYRISSFALGAGSPLTDLVCFSAEADPAGDLKLGRLKPEHIVKVKELKEKH